MKKYQKIAYFRIWLSIMGIVASIGSILLCLKYETVADIVFDIVYTLFVILFVIGIPMFVIGCILIQIIGGCILDYQMSKQLSESDFYLYMERRKMTRDDIVFEDCMGMSVATKNRLYQIRIRLDTYLEQHRLLSWYYHTFSGDCFMIE